MLLSYRFENNYCIELKRLDMPEGSPPEKVYSWLYMNNDLGLVEKLNFLSMKKSEDQIIRIFKEGKLVVSKNKVELEIHNCHYLSLV